MRIRKQFFPRTLSNIGATLFLAIAVPLTYWFELWIVIPEFHDTQKISYWLSFALGTFMMFNIMSNMMAVMLCNTSIIGENIVVPSNPNPKLWKMCAICETITPPRAWHCETCRVCILKRDHHCFFTG